MLANSFQTCWLRDKLLKDLARRNMLSQTDAGKKLEDEQRSELCRKVIAIGLKHFVDTINNPNADAKYVIIDLRKSLV